MKPQLLWASAGLWTCLLGCGAASPPARGHPRSVAPERQTPASVPATAPFGFAWTRLGPRGPATLLGTIPFGVSARQVLPDGVWREMESCGTVVVETNPAADVDPHEIARLSHYSGNESLRDHLAPPDWNTLRRILLPAIADEAHLAGMRPWFACLNLRASLAPAAHPPMEAEIFRYAQTLRRRILFLEGWRDRLELLPEILTLEELTDAIRHHDQNRERARDLVAAYRRGDVVAAGRRITELTAKGLVRARTRQWLPQLEPLLAEGDVFVAVGLAQLVAEGGLLAALRERGLVFAPGLPSNH